MDIHRLGDNASDLFGGLDYVSVSEVGLSRCASMLAVPNQLAELCVRAGHLPVVRENPDTPAFGMARKHERIRVAGIGLRVDVHPRGLVERNRARVGLPVANVDGVRADMAPAHTEDFVAVASPTA